ncbi:MAG: stage II sporulation protein P [Ruminococcus sp.]|nr:stage II sporulation protein P [Ruminococcus sp.]
MKKQGKLLKTAKATLSFILVSVSAMCVLQRLPECFGSQNPAALVAAAFTLTDGEYRLEPDKKSEKSTEPTDESETKPNEDSTETASPKIRDKSGYYDSYAEHEGEAKYEVAEQTYSADGTQVDSCYIKNKTGLELDFESILKDSLTFDVKKNTDSPQVLIYHTHTSEAYMDEDVDYFYESFYSRTQNSDFNVVGVGEAIAETLNKKGIKTLHDKTVHDSTYDGSYDRSVQTVFSDMEEYKDIKVVLDIHRDAIGTDERKIKPVFEYNGKKGAQIMIMAGCDTDGERNFENWQNNLSFALKIQNTAEKLYPGMTRPINFGYFAYNEYVCDGSLLIEVGTEANSIEEAEYTGELLADVLYEVLK